MNGLQSLSDSPPGPGIVSSSFGSVIDGSKALRPAIDAVFGAGNFVRRGRNHKERDVVGNLPRELRRCPGTTKIADNGRSALRDRVRRVKNRHSAMAVRRAA